MAISLCGGRPGGLCNDSSFAFITQKYSFGFDLASLWGNKIFSRARTYKKTGAAVIFFVKKSYICKIIGQTLRLFHAVTGQGPDADKKIE